MNDIQTEMIMNSDSSNIVSDILSELNNSSNQPNHMPIHLQMQERAQAIQPNTTLNENAVINQYDNTEISNEIHLNRQMDPHMNLNPNVRLNMKDQANMQKIQQSSKSTFSPTKLITRRGIIQFIRMIKNIVILSVILLLFLSPIVNKLSVKYIPKLFASSSSQLFKWIGLIIKSLVISIIYNIIYLFV
jgi:hypothetical protein